MGHRTCWCKELAGNCESDLEFRPCCEPPANSGGESKNYGMAIMDDVRRR